MSSNEELLLIWSVLIVYFSDELATGLDSVYINIFGYWCYYMYRFVEMQAATWNNINM
jgi:hypothetical protein